MPALRHMSDLSVEAEAVSEPCAGRAYGEGAARARPSLTRNPVSVREPKRPIPGLSLLRAAPGCARKCLRLGAGQGATASGHEGAAASSTHRQA